MNAAAHADLREFAALKWPRLNHKGRIRELARLLPWTARRVRSVYNFEVGAALRADERAAIAEITGEADALRRSQEAYRDLAARIAVLEAYFEHGDTEHGRQHLDGLRAFARGEGQGPERSGR